MRKKILPQWFRAGIVDVHLYEIFSARRYLALTAIVKLRTGSQKTARDEQVCAQQVIQEVHFPKERWGYYARKGL